ncbi:helix-turn-helix domain containing protein [Hellea sp.]|nr:helix-turn-helix domain containing protein [Hellea sp.]
MEKKPNADMSDIELLKRLAILDLVMKGVSQGDIADILGVSNATISQMFPKGVLKKYRGKGKADG